LPKTVLAPAFGDQRGKNGRFFHPPTPPRRINPLQYTLSAACLDGRLDMDLITAQGCVDVVKGWRDTKAKALADAAKGDGIPF